MKAIVLPHRVAVALCPSARIPGSAAARAHAFRSCGRSGWLPHVGRLGRVGMRGFAALGGLDAPHDINGAEYFMLWDCIESYTTKSYLPKKSVVIYVNSSRAAGMHIL